MKHSKLPLYDLLADFEKDRPISFHVPGHKHGAIFIEEAFSYFKDILKIDLTELPELDDLHAPTGAIQQAEQLAAEFFRADHTFFLVNGSTSGNIAMVLASIRMGEKALVQRNSHKSIMHALELSGANPIFLAPQYEEELSRFTSPSYETVKCALQTHPNVKAVILTYPDYFGRTYDIGRIIDLIHTYDIPVLVDEAHGVHFSLGEPFPVSSLEMGADVVVQSAHKTAPAMTQGSYLHVKTTFPLQDRIAYYLQMVQSSSPSYPLMASLDIARGYLASMTKGNIREIQHSIDRVRDILQTCSCWSVLPRTNKDDLLKITLQVKQDYSIQEVLSLLKEFHIYPELHTENQILFIHGLKPLSNGDFHRLEKAMERMNEKLKKEEIRATIDTLDISKLFPHSFTELALTYQEMNQLSYINVPFEEGIGKIAAEAVIPYPPGIPLILKGERITSSQLQTMNHLLGQGVRIQQRVRGINVFSHG